MRSTIQRLLVAVAILALTLRSGLHSETITPDLASITSSDRNPFDSEDYRCPSSQSPAVSPDWSPAETVVGQDTQGKIWGVDKPFTPYLATDGTGVVHLFCLCHIASSDRQYCPIQHRTLLGGRWKAETPIPARTPRLLTATVGSDGRLYILWSGRSTDPRFGPNRMEVYLQEWQGDSWSPAEVVSDLEAQPEPIGNGQLALAVNENSGINAFWSDLSEDHPLASQHYFPKVRHRKKSDDRWTQPDTIPGRGKFQVLKFSVVDEVGGKLHLFWNQVRWPSVSLGTSYVCHATYSNGQLSKPERLVEMRDYDGKPSEIQSLQAVHTPDGGILVAWSFLRDTGPKSEESLLQVRRFVGNSWSETLTLSHSTCNFKLIEDSKGIVGMLSQDWEPHYVRRDYPVLFSPFAATGFGKKVIVAKRVVDGLFDAIVDYSGTIHVVYTEEGAEGEFRIVHRASLTK